MMRGHLRLFFADMFVILSWPVEDPEIFRVQNPRESLRPALAK
jgi:hypothetical protein